jgi:hypothetical protein
LKREKLVLDWKQRWAARASIEVAIEQVLDKELPDAFHHVYAADTALPSLHVTVVPHTTRPAERTRSS